MLEVVSRTSLSNCVCTPTHREHAMPHTAIRPELSLIGEFIEVPAWNTIGQVIDEAPATHGSDDAIRVLLQTDPNRPGRSNWFHLEPSEYRLA